MYSIIVLKLNIPEATTAHTVTVSFDKLSVGYSKNVKYYKVKIGDSAVNLLHHQLDLPSTMFMDGDAYQEKFGCIKVYMDDVLLGQVNLPLHTYLNNHYTTDSPNSTKKDDQ